MSVAPIVLKLPPDVDMSEDRFFEFCQLNRDLRIERDRSGEIIIMPPSGSLTGNRNFNIALQLGIWAERDGTGICFDANAGFSLSMGDRSPDVSWMRLERWNTLSIEQQEKFAPLCPDFIIELRSPSDLLKPLQEKMEAYRGEVGFRLGWLIDRKQRRVYIYRPDGAIECLDNPETVSGDPVLPGFVLEMSKVW